MFMYFKTLALQPCKSLHKAFPWSVMWGGIAGIPQGFKIA